MKGSILTIFLVFGSSIVVSAQKFNFFDVVLQEWDEWKLTHGRKYNSTEEDRIRLKIFMENKARIARHNIRANRGHHSYYMRMNQYGDLLHHEFANRVNGYQGLKQKSSRGFTGASFIAFENVQVPKSIDWREKGAVTPVKDQGQCGSCWSFSATGALEGQNFRKTGKLVSLSEQNLIDCSTTYGNNGCNGGLMDFAYKYIKENGGIDSEASYPYEATDDVCRYDPNAEVATDSGFVDINQGDETALEHALATVGPISVAIDASHESLQFYSHGIYSSDDCSETELDHGVLVVGYGVDDEEDEEYWIVKNSWSEKWGDNGYFKMAKNRNNMCGIASSASYPLV